VPHPTGMHVHMSITKYWLAWVTSWHKPRRTVPVNATEIGHALGRWLGLVLPLNANASLVPNGMKSWLSLAVDLVQYTETFWVLMAISVMNTVFWNVVLCGLVEI